MKKVLLSIVALMAIGVNVLADEISIADVQIRKGKSASALVYLVSEGTYYTGFSFDVTLPEGVTCSEMTFKQTVVIDGQETLVDVTGPKGIAGTDIPAEAAFVVTSSYQNETEPQTIRFACYSGAGNPINTESNNVFVLEIPLNATGSSLSVDDVLSASVSDIHMSTSASKDIALEGVNFNIKITDPYITLYDTDTEVPANAENEDVRVVRTLKAEQWSTICLPFAIADPEAVFGEGVKIADFTGCEASGEDGDYAASIKVKFSTVNAMEANHPYLIKVASELSEFTAEGVNIAPTEDLVNAQDHERVKVGVNKYVDYYNSFFGTYVANTEIPAGSIILSGNKFYLTKGTSTKGFRGWFIFENCAIQDIEAALEEGSVKMLLDDDPTAIENIDGEPVNIEGFYDMSGRKLNDMPKTKGVYVIDGKKVAIK